VPHTKVPHSDDAFLVTFAVVYFGRSEKGQAIVEFAMVLPVFVLLIIGLMEFSLVWNSRNTVLFASRDGSMLAAEGGSLDGTDCVVLQRVTGDVVSPSSQLRILEISIYWSDRNGTQIGANQQVYTRGGTTSCTYPDGTTITVPYTLTTAGYPESARCSVLAGCGGSHTSVDTIGVRVTYQHFWVTSFVRFASTSVTFTEASITRAEPQL
jgi:Flp pilus assembly protein TadG